MNALQEKVLVVPARVLHEAGLFQGFSPAVDHYLLADQTRVDRLLQNLVASR